jgi:hypothetical protein
VTGEWTEFFIVYALIKSHSIKIDETRIAHVRVGNWTYFNRQT